MSIFAALYVPVCTLPDQDSLSTNGLTLRLLVRLYRPDDLSRLDKLGWHEDDLDATANELWGLVGQSSPVTLVRVLGFDEARLGMDWRDRQLNRLADLYGELAFGDYCGPERPERRSVSA